MIRAHLCSQNQHKLDELDGAFPGWQIALLEADDYPPEDGGTYEANARGKALYGRLAGPPGEWMLGEDSGIESDALDGAPGINSARWATGRSQADALVERLEDEPDRGARMVAVLVGISPEGEEVVARGVLEGSIAFARRGDGGFGYDPIFVPGGYEQTVAELGDDWKRVNSHRARAVQAFLASLDSPATS